ncbi:MAG: hypothetical protein V4511_04235 [Bacteroidota bacterium]
MKKTILIISIFLFIGVSKSIGQSIYNDVSFLKTTNNCWRISNSFALLRNSYRLHPETFVTSKNEAISYIKTLLPCIKKDFENFKLKFPNDIAIKTLERFIQNTEKVVEDFASEEWKSKIMMSEVITHLEQLEIEDLMAKDKCK